MGLSVTSSGCVDYFIYFFKSMELPCMRKKCPRKNYAFSYRSVKILLTTLLTIRLKNRKSVFESRRNRVFKSPHIRAIRASPMDQDCKVMAVYAKHFKNRMAYFLKRYWLIELYLYIPQPFTLIS